MKRLFPVLQICLLCIVPAISQDKATTELQAALQAQTTTLLSQQRYDDVIPVAEQIVKIERQRGEKTAGYFNARLNLARWKGQRLERARAKMKTGITNFGKELYETRDLFDSVVALAREIGDPLPLATALYEFAEFRQRFRSTAPEIESLFFESLAIREKHLPADDDLILLTTDKLSEVYFYTGAFEKFVPLNERLIEASAKKFGPEDRRLISPLSVYAGFLAMTDRGADAAKVEERISRIAGKPFKAEINWAILGRGESKIDLEFGKPSGMLIGGATAVPNPANMQVSYGLGPPMGSALSSNRDIMGVSLDMPTADPRNPARQNIAVAVLIDKTGRVLEVTPETRDAKVAGKIKERILGWKFKPFVYEGAAEKMRGRFVVTYYK
jgi:hypothetical protein